jgi:hypothetical protein
VAAGVAGTFFGLDVLAAKQEIEDLNDKSSTMAVQFSEAQAIQERGNRSALLANISFAVAGGAAVAAVVLFVTEPKAKSGAGKGERESFLTPSVGAGHVGLVWTGTF